ncbi:MAG: acetylglutamate kinase, partial [Alphaproteobacteria bacterium]
MTAPTGSSVPSADLREAPNGVQTGSDASPAERLRADWLQTGRTLTQALPFILRYDGQAVVIKYGGHAMGDPALSESFARDIVLLKQIGLRPVVVHGGGPQIAAMLERLKISSSFVQGLRVTDAATVDVVEMVLAGSINKQIVTHINRAGGRALGLSGKDGNLIIARKIHRTERDPASNIERVLDLGFVGEPEKVNPAVLDSVMQSDVIPVIAPIGMGRDGATYNINADTAAGGLPAPHGGPRQRRVGEVGGGDAGGAPLIEPGLAECEAKEFAEHLADLGGGGKVASGAERISR